jgi:predicted acylesterase/phospholipase RssA
VVAEPRRGGLASGPSQASPDAGPSVILALGGGAARSAAHIGVIRVLRGAGVRIAGIAGSSAGSLIGAMLGRGQSEDEIVRRFKAFPTSAEYREIRRTYALGRAKSQRSANPYFRESNLAFLSATDLALVGQEVFRSHLAEVPLESAEELGPGTPVLAVYLVRPERQPASFENSLEMAVRINAVTRAALVREQLAHARHLLPVPVQDIGWLGFRMSEDCMRIGEETARAALPQLLAAWSRRQAP